MLTDLQIKRLQPAEKRRIVAVGGGLSMRIEPSGRKNWIARKSGKTRGLGTYPEISLANARALAGSLAHGPLLFSEVWAQWFEEEIAPKHKRPENAASLRLIWQPIWGRRIGSLKRAELVALLRKVKARAPTRAARATSQIRSVLNYAVGLGLIETSPLFGVPGSITGAKGKTRRRVLSVDEIRGLKAQAFGRRGPHAFDTRLHARFCLFSLATLCRRGEVASARRSWLSGEVLQFPPEAMKSGRDWSVWLSPFAWSVVPDSNEDRLFDLNPKSTEAYVRRLGEGWTLHDLRRTGATAMGDLGVAPHVISRCLDHALGTGADAAYLHGQYLDERHEALLALSDWLVTL